MKLSPPPKSTTPRARERKAESAALITGSPFNKMLEEKEHKKTVKKSASSGKKQPVMKAVTKSVQNKPKPKTHVTHPFNAERGLLVKTGPTVS